MTAWWTARIRQDAEQGSAKSISGYLEELLPEDEQCESSFDDMFARLDAQIAREGARQH
jgi:phage head maturation protease